MKRFVCLLIALFLVPLFAFADDDVVGSWYLFYDKTKAPELAAAYQDHDLMISVYIFAEDGKILLSECDIKDGVGTPTLTSVGKWEKDASGYKYSIVVLGSGSFEVKDDCLFLEYAGTGIMMKLRRLVPFDPYADYVYTK